MQFIRSRIAAPRPSESRSVALWKQLGWFSASKAYATSQQPNCVSASKPEHAISRKIDSSPLALPSFLRYCATKAMTAETHGRQFGNGLAAAEGTVE